MRSWILGLLCLVLAVLVAARYQDHKAEDIDAELEALERAFKAKSEAANQKREEELQEEDLGDLDLNDLTDEELQELYERLGGEEEEKRELANEIARKRGWGWLRIRTPRIPRIPTPRIPRIPTPRIPRIPTPRIPRIPIPRIPTRFTWGK